MSVKAALREILTNIKPLAPLRLPLLKSLGHALASDIASPEPLPFFTNSAMDGYAVCSRDISVLPRILKMAEDIPAGKFPKKKIRSGTCARIMTGAFLPQGADAVVPLEQTDIPAQGYVRVRSTVREGQYIRPKGQEINSGDKIFSKGRVLKPADLGLLASLGINAVRVIAKPSISLITSGSEIVGSSATPRLGQIRNSNIISMKAALTALGVSIRRAEHIKDNLRDIKSALLKCDSDVIITCGGVSVGGCDFVKQALSECGKLIFWKVAMKPGKPFLFGQIGWSWVFGLPGNPVSALVTYEILVKPTLLALAGQKNILPIPEEAVLTSPLKHASNRQEYVRARVHRTKRGSKITPLPWQGSGMLRSLTEANAWIVVPRKVRRYPAGSAVNFLPQR